MFKTRKKMLNNAQIFSIKMGAILICASFLFFGINQKDLKASSLFGTSSAAGVGFDNYASVLSLVADGDDLLIRDAITPANNYSGTPYNKFNEASGPKRVFDSSGELNEQNYLFRTIPKESYFDVPDGLGGDPGEGFTITGLAYDGTYLWAGNDGIAQDGGAVSHPSVVKMSITGTKIVEYSMETIYGSDGSVQGVAYDTSDDTLWIAAVVDGEVRHMTTEGVDIGDGFSVAAANGLTYDSTRDRLWILVGDILTRRQKDGTIDYTKDLGSGVWDQLHYDVDRDYIWITEGDNGEAGQLYAFNITTETIVDDSTVSDVTATEGMTIIDGDFYVAHDGYRHAAAVIRKNQVQIYPAVKGAASIAWAVDHDPIDSNNILGYLIEPEFTRRNAYPTSLDWVGWSKSGLSVSANAVISPTGEQDAETLTAASGTSAHWTAIAGSTSAGTAKKHATEIFIKAGTHSYVWIGDRGDAGGIHSASFDLSLGTVIGQSNATGAIRSIGDDWYVISLKYTHNTAGVPAVDIAFGAATHTLDRPSITCVGTETLHVLYGGVGAQPFESSPVFSITDPIRAADEPVLASSNFDFSTTTQITFTWQARTAYGSSSQVLFQADDGTVNEKYRLERNSSRELHFIVTDGGVEQCNLDFGVVADNTDLSINISVEEDDFEGSLDGGASVTCSSGTLPAVTTLRIGHSNTGEQWSSTVYSGAIFSKPLPTAPTIGVPTVLSPSSIRWNFTDNADNETGFRIYNNANTQVSISANENLSYVDETGLSPNTSYSGRYVSAYNNYGEGASSVASTIYTKAETPSSASWGAVSTPNSITLSIGSFPNSSSGQSGYYFSRSGANSGWIQTNSWEDTGLVAGNSYVYSVKYRNGDGVETSEIFTTKSTESSSGMPGTWSNTPAVPTNGFEIDTNSDTDTNSGIRITSDRVVTLNFNAGSDVKRMAISFTGDFNDASQEEYSSIKQVDLCSKFGGAIKSPTCADGQYVVYVKFYTQYGKVSDTISVKIKLEKTSSSKTADLFSEETNLVTAQTEGIELSENNKNIYDKITINHPSIVEKTKISIAYFIEFGTPSTEILGAGERAGVLNSYISAFDKVPSLAEDWQDIIKIANGRWPSERSEDKENKAKEEFKFIYKKEADMNQLNDNAAVTVMAYGLRPANRNLNSEKAAIKIFKDIYKYAPESAIDWDIVRAIAYSGAVR